MQVRGRLNLEKSTYGSVLDPGFRDRSQTPAFPQARPSKIREPVVPADEAGLHCGIDIPFANALEALVVPADEAGTAAANRVLAWRFG